MRLGRSGFGSRISFLGSSHQQMNDQQKSKQQLIEELEGLRARRAAMETSPDEDGNADGGLRLAAGKVRVLLDDARECVIAVDLDFNLTDVNDAALKTFGLPDKEAALGRKCFEAFKGRDDVCPGCAVVEVYRTGAPAYRTSTPADVDVAGGKFMEVCAYPLVDEEGNLAGAIEFARDLSRQEQAEQVARQSRDELRTIYDGMVDGLLIADMETREFVRANRSICQMLGYSEDELLTMSVKDLHRPEDLPKVLEGFKAQASGRMPLAQNIPFLRKDGSLFYADVSATGMVYNQRLCMIGFLRDVTQRREAEEALRGEREHLRRLLEMHEQNRKLVAYEIHDGLVQTLVAARMLLEGAKPVVDKHGSDSDKESCQTGLQLLGHVVDQARVLMGGQRPLILDERGLLAAIEYLVHEGEKCGGAKIGFTHDAQFTRLASPLETAVFRIVQESLANAARHSQSEEIRIELDQHDDWIRVTIEDWGTGFAIENVAQSCFGLEGIRERARLFGGEANIDSTPGKGTRITVELPVVEA